MSAFEGTGASRNVGWWDQEFPAGQWGFSQDKKQDGAGNLPQMS